MMPAALKLFLGAALAAAVAIAPRARAQPANDLCANAITVGFPSTTPGTNIAANSDIPATSCAFSPTDSRDVWFRFTAPFAAVFTFDTNGSTGLLDTTLAVLSACPPGGVELACSDDDGDGLLSRTSVLLSAGQVVFIRVAGWNHRTGAFVLNVSGGQPPLPNDLCASAAAIAPGQSVSGSNVGATGLDVSSCASSDAFDVWYRLLAPIRGRYPIDTLGPGTLTDTTLSVFAACGGAELACNDDADTGQYRSSLNLELQANTHYFIRVAGFGGTTGTFTLSVGQPTPIQNLPNDQCSSATLVGSLPFLAANIDLNLAADDLEAVTCDQPDLPGLRRGIWFRFIPAASGAIRIRETGPLPTVTGVFTAPGGTCSGGLFEIACDTTGDLILPVTGGATYYIALGFDALGALPASALITLSIESVSPPANDSCWSPAPIALNTPVTGSNVGATTDIDLIPCTDGAPDTFDVWYRFIPSTTGVYLIDTRGGSGGPGAIDDTTLSVWTGCPPTAGGNGALVACNDEFAGQSRAVINARLTAGVPYLIRVAGYDGEIGAFPLVVSPGVTVPHETCATAMNIGLQYVGTIDTTFALSENAEPPGACNDEDALGVAHSVWLRFVPTASGPLLGTIDSATYDQLVVVYVGACGLLTPIACYDQEPADLSTLPVMVGQTYFICIGAFSTASGGVSSVNIQLPGSAGTMGACCRGVTCMITTAAGCTSAASRFAGLGTLCQSGVPACCLGDFNQSGAVTVQDIFDFLSAYFSGSPLADTTGNGLSVQDIFDFLSAYFSGCS